MHLHLGARFGSVKCLRECGNRLQLLQAAVLRVIRKSRERHPHFIDDINESAIRTKHQVPGSRAGLNGRKRRVIGRERAPDRVEAINEHLVEAQIAGERKVIARIAGDEMGVRPRLALRVYTGAPVLNDRARFAQTAVRLNRKRGDAAGAIIGDQETFPGFIHR